MQNLIFRILDKIVVSTVSAETAFVGATTITRRGTQEHITYMGRHVNPSIRKPTCLEVGTVSRRGNDGSG